MKNYRTCKHITNLQGVYKITNTVTNKVYIGSSLGSLRKRINVHIHCLSENKHHSPKLQNSWNKYGEEAFEFDIIEVCERKDCLEREQYWIDYYDSYNKGYNSSPKAGNCEGRIVSDDTRKKISRKLKNKPISYIRPPEYYQKTIEAKKKKVYHINKDGNLIEIFDSQKEACIKLGIHQDVASRVCNGKRKLNTGNILTYNYGIEF